jgi:hypothetical protein
MAVVGAALFVPAAQAAPTLTMNEARLAVINHGYEAHGQTYFGVALRKCSRLASNRVRCSVRFTIETSSTVQVKSCRSRIEVVENAEIKARTLSRNCRKRNISYLTYERASHAAAQAMDPKATHPNYEMGFGGGSLGKNRYLFEATWVTEKNQTCLQTARVRLVKKKVRVNVSEIACVDDPDWP